MCVLAWYSGYNTEVTCNVVYRTDEMLLSVLCNLNIMISLIKCIRNYKVWGTIQYSDLYITMSYHHTTILRV